MGHGRKIITIITGDCQESWNKQTKREKNMTAAAVTFLYPSPRNNFEAEEPAAQKAGFLKTAIGCLVMDGWVIPAPGISTVPMT